MSDLVAPAVAVQRARAVAAGHPGETVFLGVDGWGGSGKTTLAERICQALPGCVVIHVDDFASPSVPEWDWRRFDRQVVEPLLAGRSAHYQRWDWNADAGREWHDVTPGRPILVEGVSSTRCEVRLPWALTVWVEAPREVRLARALERDGAAMLATWTDVWLPQEEAYVARERPQRRVDLVVDGTAA